MEWTGILKLLQNLCSYLGCVYLDSIVLYDRFDQICIGTQRTHQKYILLLLLFVIMLLLPKYPL